jgi:hypothetical protein
MTISISDLAVPKTASIEEDSDEEGLGGQNAPGLYGARAKHLSIEKDGIAEKISEIQVETIRRIAEICRANAYSVYRSPRTEKIADGKPLPFHLSPNPFRLSPELKDRIREYGVAIASYYGACSKLYQNLPKDHRWKKYLDHSKAEDLIVGHGGHPRHHIFIRPDFILTDDEVFVTEIETSPFGLPLSLLLNSLYQESGAKPFSPDTEQVLLALTEEMGLMPGKRLAFVMTPQTEGYRGQFEYLAAQFKSVGIEAEVLYPEDLVLEKDMIKNAAGQQIHAIYKCFYPYQIGGAPILERLQHEHEEKCFPAFYPQMEEKALLGMIHAKEFEHGLRDMLGNHYDILKRIIPRTYVVDANNVPDELVPGMNSWTDIADLPTSRRQFVLKPSGFSPESSWSKGVMFLAKMSKNRCREAILKALNGHPLYIIQEFRKGSKHSQQYFDFGSGSLKEMKGKVRLTPYYLVRTGELLTIKSTMCSNTDYVHAMIDSINSPVL